MWTQFSVVPKKINKGIWFPFINDCHDRAVDCLEQAGVPPEDIPPHPRTHLINK